MMSDVISNKGGNEVVAMIITLEGQTEMTQAYLPFRNPIIRDIISSVASLLLSSPNVKILACGRFLLNIKVAVYLNGIIKYKSVTKA